MLAELFYWVLNVSIIGSFAGLAVLALRRIKRLPRLMVCSLWVLPLLRFWIPFGIANKYSLLNVVSQFTTRTVVVWDPAPAGPEFTMTNAVMAAESYFPVIYKTASLEAVFRAASLLWIIVAAAAVIAAVLLYALTKSELKSAEHIEGDIFKSNKIVVPAVYGIIRPRIILPAALAQGDIGYILMHERVHMRRRDNLWRVVAVVTACVHWFNPLVWVLLKYFFADMELACDEKVVQELDEARVGEYASAVLSASSGKAFFASAFGGAKTKVRIENILSYKKLTAIASLCFAALVFAVAVILMTNAPG